MKKYFVPFILIAISFYSALIISVIFFFSYLGQSIHTPKGEQLGVLNYLLPFLFTIGFIIYFNIYQLLLKSLNKKSHWVVLLILFLTGTMALAWQVKHIHWYLSHDHSLTDVNISDYLPFIVGILSTLGTIAIHARKILGFIKKVVM